MSDQSKKGFKVIDRRGRGEAKEPQPDPEVEGPGWKMHQDPRAPGQEPVLPADFTTFCLSLASAALIHLGEVPAPESGKAEPDLPLAKQSIDFLAMLHEKTKGNLSPSEDKLLSTILYDLRLRFVEASRPGPREKV